MHILKKNWKDLKKNKSLIFLSLPGILVIFVFSYLPMLGTIVAFKDLKFDLGIWKSKWVGLKNFEFFFTSQSAWTVTRNTLLMNGLFIVTGTTVSVLLALMLYELSGHAVKFYQSFLFFPYFISWVVVSYAAYALLSSDYGGINTILKDCGMEPVIWYQQPKYWIVILALANMWKYVGYYIILFYTVLIGIDISYFEAAMLDGASRLQQVRYVSIPMLVPLIMMLTLISIGRIFYSDFGMFYFLPRNSSALYSVTDVIDTYVYRALTNTGDIGMAAASGLYQSVVGFLLILTANWIVRKINKYSAIF